MNRLKLILALLLMGWTTVLYAQKENPAIKKIEARATAIDKAKGLAVKILRDREISEEATDGGMTLTGYYKNDTLLKMNFWVATFDGIWDCNYYYSNDSLIYANEKQKTYLVDSAKQTLDYNHTTLKTENKFYFSKGKLIKKSSNGAPMTYDIPDEKIVEEIHKYVNDYYSKLEKTKAVLKQD